MFDLGDRIPQPGWGPATMAQPVPGPVQQIAVATLPGDNLDKQIRVGVAGDQVTGRAATLSLERGQVGRIEPMGLQGRADPRQRRLAGGAPNTSSTRAPAAQPRAAPPTTSKGR